MIELAASNPPTDESREDKAIRIVEGIDLALLESDPGSGPYEPDFRAGKRARDVFEPSRTAFTRETVAIDDYERTLVSRWLFRSVVDPDDEANPTRRIHFVHHFLQGMSAHNAAASMLVPRDIYGGFDDDLRSSSLFQGMKDDPAVDRVYGTLARTARILAERTLPTVESAIQKRVRWFGDLFGLDPLETDLVGFLVRNAFSGAHHDAMEAVGSAFNCRHRLLVRGTRFDLRICARVLGVDVRDLREAVAEGVLARTGLVRPEKPAYDEIESQDWNIDIVVRRIVFSDAATEQDVVALVVPPPAPSKLSSSDFQHLGSAVGDAIALAGRASAEHEPGVGIVLAGPVGTGKTEFAKVIAAEAGLTPVLVGQTARSEPTREERLSHLLLVAHLSERCGGMLIVVDEAEELFLGNDSGRPSERRGSKVFLNGRVETIRAPVVWITNNPSAFGASIVRRMSLVVEFETTSERLRQAIAERIVRDSGLDVPQDRIDAVVASHASPAVIANGLRAARLLGDVDRGLAAMTSVQDLLGHRMRRRGTDAAYDTSFLRADADVAALEERIVSSGRLDFSMLLSGVSGTGKSAFARHLSRRLGLEPVLVKASNVFASDPGRTEQNIAALFRSAERHGQFLILDEADGLLLDRGAAALSRELAQVNEMLTWLEDHPMPLVATTNLAHRLDPATRRRFDFKIVFRAMDEVGVAAAFRAYFGFEPSKRVRRLDDVVPGDLAVVRRQADIRGVSDHAGIEELLDAEIEGKEKRLGSIGFGGT